MNDELILGTEAKIRVTIAPIGGITPYVFDFDVELYVNPKRRATISKYNCIPLEEQYAFFVPFDTSDVGIGEVTMEVVAYVPDTDFEDGLRTERVRIESVATIIP